MLYLRPGEVKAREEKVIYIKQTVKLTWWFCDRRHVFGRCGVLGVAKQSGNCPLCFGLYD
jgi:hypothetical protein